MFHNVQQGEYLSTIARKYGFAEWNTIYDHPNNAEFRTARPNPNVIFPGDKLYIPDPKQKVESCATDQKHVFQIVRRETVLRIVLKDDDDKPYASMQYQFKVPGENKPRSGSTDKDGKFEQTIPVGIGSVDLVLSSVALGWSLQIGHLDPVHKEGKDEPIITGIQARLRNLGYDCGAVDGVFGPRTQAALKEFQQDVLKRTAADGKPDYDTRIALRKEHGC